MRNTTAEYEDVLSLAIATHHQWLHRQHNLKRGECKLDSHRRPQERKLLHSKIDSFTAGNKLLRTQLGEEHELLRSEFQQGNFTLLLDQLREAHSRQMQAIQATTKAYEDATIGPMATPIAQQPIAGPPPPAECMEVDVAAPATPQKTSTGRKSTERHTGTERGQQAKPGPD